jgi:hypothetical protein
VRTRGGSRPRPWHSVNSDIYHDNPNCQTGSSIDPENIQPGTGGNRLCEECARLNRAAGPVGDLLASDFARGPREEALPREAEPGPTARSFTDAGVRRTEEPRVERLSEDAVRSAARRGAREVLDEEEQEESGGGGLYGSQIDASHIVGAAIAELVGTFILVFGGTAVAVGAILSRPTAGAAYDSLAVALAFGLALAVVVAAIGHVSSAPGTTPPTTWGRTWGGRCWGLWPPG